MSEMLDDMDNLKLMEELISGNAVSVNISELARILGKHRNTIKNKVDALCSEFPVYEGYPEDV